MNGYNANSKSYEQNQMKAMDRIARSCHNLDASGAKENMYVLIKTGNLLMRTYTEAKGYEVFMKPIGEFPQEIQGDLDIFPNVRRCLGIFQCVRDDGKISMYSIFDDGAMMPVGDVDLELDMSEPQEE